ncbi:MAG: VOC family protein [Bacillota bacterium]
MKFTWVTLRVRNLERSMEFYQGVLDLPKHSTHGQGGTRIIMLGKDKEPLVELIEEADSPATEPGTGISVGFAVDSLEDAISHVEKHGYPVAIGPIAPNPHVRFVYIHDPDGYLVQLVETK